MHQQEKSIQNKVLNRIRGWGRGKAFTASDFLDLGRRDAVDQALVRLYKDGSIRRVAWGLYDFPRHHPELGALATSTDAILDAVRRRDARRLMPSGAFAANILGLSEQVPMRIVMLTDGGKAKLRIGKREILLKPAAVRSFAVHPRTGLVIQALKYIGQRNINDGHIRKLASSLGEEDRQLLQRDLKYAPVWIARLLAQHILAER